ncbi:ABC transporter permease [Lutibaculum baratangense]|uniref:Branched-chain amino acid transport system permease protein LivM n=1 Tax=Lutibaculum baratangense AMV1 TaxID=631454 RepID=V4RCG0_9HYPH|nr:ABC transporter permease [Lutibaculum baratangense]ESR23079.1 Branched-chain amino acid transport system permease protein LivM [Lutibaculum baratangense AMV1]
MSLYVVQFLAGLANAASLFLAASGLSLIFGVTRIVNFAHGAFYMLGAYMAFTLTRTLDGAVGFWAAILIAAAVVAVMGALLEMVLLRRIYQAPELFQLLATFGVTLMVEDIVLLVWGPEDLVGPRAPGLEGAILVMGRPLPTYDILLIALGPIVLLGLWLLMHRTRWGVLVRAATQDRDMVAALGVNQKWLFTGVFTLGIFLAALGGALQIPRTAVSHHMDLSIIVEVFVITVIGGLGSITGAFLAAILVSLLNAFGILIFPSISLVLIFLCMAVVLVIRPWGFLGKPVVAGHKSAGVTVRPWQPWSREARIGAAIVVAIAALLPFWLGTYGLFVGAEMMIAVIFAVSLQFLMSTGGLDSFGHAAYFGLGAYGAAMAVKWLGAPMEAALLIAPLTGLVGALVFGWFCVRLSGVYFAMLTLAFAQILWSIAFQWVPVTGGDNGILGVWPSGWASSPATYYWLTLAVAVFSVAALRMLVFSPFGYALRGVRDSTLRASAIGFSRQRVQYAAFAVAGAFAGLAGALFAFLKGSIFPDALSIPQSVDGLVMVLLGGIATVSGSVVGAIVYTAASIWLMSQTDLSRLVLGGLIVVLVVAFPKGIVGSISDLVGGPLFRRRGAGPAGREAAVAGSEGA